MKTGNPSDLDAVLYTLRQFSECGPSCAGEAWNEDAVECEGRLGALMEKILGRSLSDRWGISYGKEWQVLCNDRNDSWELVFIQGSGWFRLVVLGDEGGCFVHDDFFEWRKEYGLKFGFWPKPNSCA